LPLHIRGRIGATTRKRDDVILYPARVLDALDYYRGQKATRMLAVYALLIDNDLDMRRA
jgi:hypothetical protein